MHQLRIQSDGQGNGLDRGAEFISEIARLVKISRDPYETVRFITVLTKTNV
jgi:hypothetical protein